MTTMRLALFSLVALGACVPDFDLDLTGPGEFQLYDDGTTLVASACPSGAFIGCEDAYDTPVAMTVDGVKVPFVRSGALFSDMPFEASAPSPTDRTVGLAWTTIPTDGQGASYERAVDLLPDFDFQVFPPTDRSRPAKLIVQQLGGATITVDIVSTCNGVSNEVAYEVDARTDLMLAGDGSCDHLLTVEQTVTTGTDDLMFHSTRFSRTSFSTPN